MNFYGKETTKLMYYVDEHTFKKTFNTWSYFVSFIVKKKIKPNNPRYDLWLLKTLLEC